MRAGFSWRKQPWKKKLDVFLKRKMRKRTAVQMKWRWRMLASAFNTTTPQMVRTRCKKMSCNYLLQQFLRESFSKKLQADDHKTASLREVKHKIRDFLICILAKIDSKWKRNAFLSLLTGFWVLYLGHFKVFLLNVWIISEVLSLLSHSQTHSRVNCVRNIGAVLLKLWTYFYHSSSTVITCCQHIIHSLRPSAPLCNSH